MPSRPCYCCYCLLLPPHPTLSAMNTAARMQTHGKEMHCHIGEATAKLLVGDKSFHIERRGKLSVKGKGTMQTYFLRKAGSDTAIAHVDEEEYDTAPPTSRNHSYTLSVYTDDQDNSSLPTR